MQIVGDENGENHSQNTPFMQTIVEKREQGDHLGSLEHDNP